MLMYVDQLNLTHLEWIGIFFYWLMTIVWRLGYIFSNKNPRYFLHSRRSKLLSVTIWSRPCDPIRPMKRIHIAGIQDIMWQDRTRRVHIKGIQDFMWREWYSLFLIHYNRTTLWKGRIDLLWTWFGPCWRVKTCQRNYGLKLLIVLCIYRIAARPGVS